MKQHFHSDNGAACWRCDGTIYTYTVDEYVTYVGARCVSCQADNMFYPPAAKLDTAADVSAAHRETVKRLTDMHAEAEAHYAKTGEHLQFNKKKSS